ncbi:MAG: hypothetical protein ACT4P6_03515 [Gemmatimonadaceae bacterium]
MKCQPGCVVRMPNDMQRLLRATSIVLCSVCALLACSNPFGTSREIALSMADIEAPATITAAGPLDITVIVRTGGCVTFRRLDVARGGPIVNINAVGHDASGPTINCPADVREERKALRITGTFADSVILNGRQPDGSVLRRRVVVVGAAEGTP